MRPTWPAVAVTARDRADDRPCVPTLRLLSYNVRSLRDDRDAVARVIRARRARTSSSSRRRPGSCAGARPARRWPAAAAWSGRAGGRPAAAEPLMMSSLAVDVRRSRGRAAQQGPQAAPAGLAMAELLAGAADSSWPARTWTSSSRGVRHVELDAATPSSRSSGVAVDHRRRHQRPAGRRAVDLLGVRRRRLAAVGTAPASPTAPPTRSAHRRLFADPRLDPCRAVVLDSADARSASDHRPLLVELGCSAPSGTAPAGRSARRRASAPAAANRAAPR